MTTAVIAAYYAVLGLLALYGLHRLVLLLVLARTPATPLPESDGEWPHVTVQLPIFNEIYVAPRLLAAAARLDYPRELLEIQVLDDSTDDTSEIVARDVAALRERGLDVVHLRRQDRSGFKAGALEAGMSSAKGELIAVFDADFVPEADFLRRTVPAFSDPEVGMVQTRWDHINRESSLLTRAQAVLLDGHFLIEHDARARAGRFFNFNGTAGIWRRETIVAAGGWQHDTLTEDLDLSYRAQLRGWRFVFLPRVDAPAELPVSMTAFKGQQKRWTRGAVQTLRKLGGRIATAPLPVRTRLEALIHLTSNLCYVLLVVLALLLFPSMWLRTTHFTEVPLLFDLTLILVATGAVGAFYVASQLRAGRPLSEALCLLPAVMALGTGLAVHNAVAATSGLFRKGGVFERTPKYCIEQRGQSWKAKRYRAAIGRSTILEIALTAYLTACMATALAVGMWWSTPFLALLLFGFGWVTLATLSDGLARPAPRSGAAEAEPAAPA